jgi:hypothetical protein
LSLQQERRSYPAILEVAANKPIRVPTAEPENVSPAFDPLLLESYKTANLSMKESSFAGFLKSDIFICAESICACMSMSSADVKGDMERNLNNCKQVLVPENPKDTRHSRSILLKI